MRITVSDTPSSNRHTDACTAVATSLGGDILSGGDDCAVWRWNVNCEPMGKLISLDSCITVVMWLPGSGKKRGDAKDSYVVACADGTYRFVSAATNRVEKVVEAHQGAITALTYSPDGSTIVTAGEDGTIKSWSQAGIQRGPPLAQTGKCIYTLVWGTESADYSGDCVLYTCGSDVVVKPLNPAIKKQLLWKAHTGVVLCADWSRMSNLIVTGGEDGSYKVWDPYGRNLFASIAGEHPVTSIAFAPDGEMFAIGSFNCMRVCDKTGWTQCREQTTSGSVMAMAWTSDGTQIAFGTGNGALQVAQLVDRKKHWRNLTVTLTDGKKLHIQDVANGTTEELEHRDKVIKLSVGYGYLVVATSTQCIVYDVQRWSGPAQFDLRDAVVTLAQAEKTFLIADCTQGVQIFTYEGRLVCTMKVAATIRPEMLTANLISFSRDTLAIRDPADAKKVVFYDTTGGKLLKETVIEHHMEITDLALSQYGALQERKLVFIDRNRDMYLATVHVKHGCHKLATMVSSMKWNDVTETLVALADNRLVTWFYPSVVFIDRDLLARTRHTREDGAGEDFGSNDQIADFFGTRVGVSRGVDGALLTFGISPFPELLFGHVSRHDWDSAVKLCRFLNDPALWGILVALAIKSSELNTAEVAYAALDEVDKLRYINSVKEIPSPEGRQAELVLFQRRLEEAERILLQAGLVFRCIEMHMRLYNWERALEIAVERRTHVDTVVAFRQRHLESVGRKETFDKFKQVAASIKVDWEAINEKVKQEKAKEKQRPGAKPYQ